MRVLQVVSGINPQSGGPTRSVKGVCRALSLVGVDVTLLVLHGHHAFDNPCGVKVIYAEGSPLSTSTSNFNLKSYDLVHLQGLWDWKLHKMAVACRKAKVPYVISPRGMLDPWALSTKKWKKRVALILYQRRDLKKAVAFHVTAEMERDHVRDLGYTQPCIIAPNGVEVPEVLPGKPVGCDILGATRTAIFLSRLHPGKGLLTLAEVWARVNPRNWIMKVVGPDSYGHKAEVLAKLDALGIVHFDCPPPPPTSTSSYWQFVDTLDDVEKWSAYRAADLLIHPSVSENFGITIVEGLYAELPAIATKGTPWKDLVDYNCGWWIDQGVDALEKTLHEAISLSDDERMAMGRNGHALVETKYAWPAIAKQVLSGYEKIIGNVI